MLWIAPLAILAILALVAIGGELVMLLWNWLLPPLFGWRQIGLWQGVGLLALCRILFGGFGHRGSVRSSLRRRMAERWENLTPQERETFRQAMARRCGFGSPKTESQGQ